MAALFESLSHVESVKVVSAVVAVKVKEFVRHWFTIGSINVGAFVSVAVLHLQLRTPQTVELSSVAPVELVTVAIT